MPRLIVLLLSLCACTRTHTVPEPDGAIPIRDGGTTRIDGGRDAGAPAECAEASPVDLLFVIDNSNDMVEQQASLAAELPAFLDALRNPPDRDGDGETDWLPITDLHVGVVDTDMGTGGFAVPTCAAPAFGDDGILRTRGNTSITGCMATYPPFLTAGPGTDTAALASDLRCVANMGTGGCGFEQPLDATLKALTPSSSPLRFAMGTTGHGDTANAGFLRDGSLLAVVLLTTEPDCSAADPELFDPASPTYSGNLNLRCFLYPDALHPVERYVDGLVALRPGRPDLFVFASIAGIPTDLVGPAGGTDYDAVLADPRMEQRVDPSDPNRLLPSCNVPGRGLAFPPRRIVRVARGVEARGAAATVQSVCQVAFTVPMEAIATAIGDHACARFLE